MLQPGLPSAIAHTLPALSANPPPIHLPYFLATLMKTTVKTAPAAPNSPRALANALATGSRSQPLPRRPTALLGVLMGALLSVSVLPCSEAQAAASTDAARLYEDAQIRFDKNDLPGASIQAKNALQKDPNLLSAYLLLGRTLLKQGKAVEAEQTLRRAMSMGVDRIEIVTLLSQSLLDQGKSRQVMDIDLNGLPPTTLLDMRLVRAAAQMDMGNLQTAQTEIDEARRIDPRSPLIFASTAALRLRERNFMAARQAADQALAIDSSEPRFWMTRATTSHGMGDIRGALADYGQAIKLNDRFVDARVARASLLMDLGRDNEAWQDLEVLRQQEDPDFPDPRGAYLRALYSSRKKDVDGVRNGLNEVIKAVEAIPQDILVRRTQYLLLAALAYHGTNQTEKARGYLQLFLSAEPRHVGARKLLASILITTRDYDGVVSTLEPILKQAPRDTAILSMLASANLGLNRPQKASELLEQAAAGADDPNTRTSIGLTMIGVGQIDNALEQLRRAVKADPKQLQAATALTVIELKRGNKQGAIAVAQQVVAQSPKSALAYNLLGTAKGASGDLNGARAAYQKAVSLEPSFTPAQLNLAKLEAQDNKPDAARAQFNTILKQQPRNTAALYELARLEWSTGRRNEAIRHMEKILSLDPRNVRAATELIDRHIEMRATDKALEVAKDMAIKIGDTPESLAAQARVYIALADRGNAKLILDKLVRQSGYDANILTGAAELQLAAGLTDSARYTLEKALSNTANHVPAEIMLANMDLQARDFGKAESRIRSLQQRLPSEPSIQRLAGRLALGRGQATEALTIFSNLAKNYPGSASAQDLADAYLKSGQYAKGLEALRAIAKSRPNDTSILRTVADYQLHINDKAGAQATYQALLKLDPKNVGALNNLAYIQILNRDSGAVETATRAHQLAPDNPNASDTLGWALLQNGKLDEALLNLREARLRAPNSADIRYHLAAALEKANKKEEARKEIAEALRLGGLSDPDGAKALQGRLGSR